MVSSKASQDAHLTAKICSTHLCSFAPKLYYFVFLFAVELIYRSCFLTTFCCLTKDLPNYKSINCAIYKDKLKKHIFNLLSFPYKTIYSETILQDKKNP